MSIQITMPALSPTMEEGNLVKWNVKEGDDVTTGDIIAEIETDKATMEVEAVDDGKIAKIVVPEGTQGVKVNTVIAVLAEEGEDVAEVTKTAVTTAGVVAKDAQPQATSQPSSGSENGKLQLTPPPMQMVPTSSSGAAQRASVPTVDSMRKFSSPLARRLALQNGLDINQIEGTGPHGRVIKRDVDTIIARGGQEKPSLNAVPSSTSKATTHPPSDDQILKLFKESEYEIAPHDGMRKTIAKRLVESKQTVPHFYVTVDCELDALLKLRSQLNAAAPIKKTEAGDKPAYKLSVNDMIIKATALALKAVPAANVSWLDSGMLWHKHVDVGVAVSIPNGLITPIVRHADEKSFSMISNEMKDLAKRARERKLKPEEYQGGSTSVSNMGMFGVKNFSAIINPPQATIFAIGAGQQRAVVKNGEVAIATIMSVTLSTDHRAVDGALAAKLAQAFKNLVENPLSMVV